MHHREAEAGIDALAVHQHRAGATLAMVAPLFHTGKVEMFTQRVEQRRPRVEIELLASPIDGKSNFDDFVHFLSRFWRGNGLDVQITSFGKRA